MGATSSGAPAGEAAPAGTPPDESKPADPGAAPPALPENGVQPPEAGTTREGADRPPAPGGDEPLARDRGIEPGGTDSPALVAADAGAKNGAANGAPHGRPFEPAPELLETKVVAALA